LRAFELKLEEYNEAGVNITETQNEYELAVAAFKKERYEEAETKLVEMEIMLEEKRAEMTILNAIKKLGKHFYNDVGNI